MRGRSSRVWTLVLAALAGWAGAYPCAPVAGRERATASVTRGAEMGFPLEVPSSVSALAAPTAEAPGQTDGHPQAPAVASGAVPLAWQIGPGAAPTPPRQPAALLALAANPATAPPHS